MVDPRSLDPLASDPIGTVRVHPDDDPMKPAVRRRIKVESSDYSGPYERACWERLTSTFRKGSLFGQEGTDPVQSEYVLTWPVQPWWQVAAVLELPSAQEDAQTLVKRRAEVREGWLDFLIEVMGSSHMSGSEVVASREQIADRITTAVLLLERQRDQALAHDRQPYPTAWSYEKLSQVYNELTDGLKRQLEPLVGQQTLDDHPGHLGLLEVVGELCTEAKLGHRMSEMLLELDYDRGPQGLADFISSVRRAQAEMLDQEKQIEQGAKGPWSIVVPDELEEAMRTGIAGWLEAERADIHPLTPEEIARGAAGAAYAVLEAGSLVLAPELRSGPLVRVALGLPSGMYISEVYARLRAAGFELQLSAEKIEG